MPQALKQPSLRPLCVSLSAMAPKKGGASGKRKAESEPSESSEGEREVESETSDSSEEQTVAKNSQSKPSGIQVHPERIREMKGGEIGKGPVIYWSVLPPGSSDPD